MRGQLVMDLPLDLDRSSAVGLGAQLVTGLRRLIDQGRLRRGDALPSTRALATSLAISRGTVVTAYDQLQAEGYLIAEAGSGTHVGRVEPSRSSPSRVRARARSGATDRLSVDLRPGTPDVTAIASPAWRRAWREAAGDPHPLDDPLGLPALREEVAEHLRLMRALVRPPQQVLITSGAREGLALLLATLGRGGHRPIVGVERPGHPALSGVPAAMGLRTVPLATDEGGLVTSALPEGPGRMVPDVVIVTPSHQYPHGGSLSVTRRQELLGWARRTGALVVEDDYDSELRYVGMPLPALATLDDAEDGRVVLLGTFSTVLTPAVATGYLVVPTWLAPELASHRRATGLPTPALVQQALAGYLASGELRRHIQRMRRDYGRRRAVIVEELGRAPGIGLAPLTGGLHAAVHTAEAGHIVAARCARHQILVGDLADFWGPRSRSTHGIVLGFGSLPAAALRAVLPTIARCCLPDTGLGSAH